MVPVLTDRLGFDAAFLDQPLQLPSSDAVRDDFVLLDGSPVIPYTHFSLGLSRSRRLARWVAWNIDGSTLFDGDTVSRSGISFRPDPRLPEDVQTLDEVYVRNRLDRGHLARRADLLWGSRAAADAANTDSFYFTNISPQMDNFNQSGQQGLWGLLENALLEEVSLDRQRVSVLGGPVLAAADPPYRGVQVPREFWKVLIYGMDGELRSRAFLVSQSLVGLELRPLDAFNTYLVTMAQLQERTELRFDPALLVAQTRGAAAGLAGAGPQLIEEPADLRW